MHHTGQYVPYKTSIKIILFTSIFGLKPLGKMGNYFCLELTVLLKDTCNSTSWLRYFFPCISIFLHYRPLESLFLQYQLKKRPSLKWTTSVAHIYAVIWTLIFTCNTKWIIRREKNDQVTASTCINPFGSSQSRNHIVFLSWKIYRGGALRNLVLTGQFSSGVLLSNFSKCSWFLMKSHSRVTLDRYWINPRRELATIEMISLCVASK